MYKKKKEAAETLDTSPGELAENALNHTRKTRIQKKRTNTRQYEAANRTMKVTDEKSESVI